MRSLRVPEILGRPIFRATPHLASVLWALLHFGLGLLLWQADMFLEEPVVHRRWLLVTLAVVCVAIAIRRSSPGVGVLLGGAAVAVDTFLGASLWIFVAFGDLLYASMVSGGRRLAYTVLGVTVSGHLLLFGFFLFALADGVFTRGAAEMVQILALCVMVFLTPVLTGMTLREHRERARLDRERAERVERLAQLDRAEAVSEERGRMARELHDVVANHLSAVAIQSTAALTVRELEPDTARRVLEVVRDNSVQGLEEMRRMIRLLRSDTDNAESDRTTPGLSGVKPLLSRMRRAGLKIRFTERGEASHLPSRIDVIAYRVLQEALTNALRHASPPQAEILLAHHRAPDTSSSSVLLLEVVNPTTTLDTAWDSRLGSSMGLTGMRERVDLLGGVFEAGPVGGGHWRVHVVLPVQAGQKDEKNVEEEIER